MTKRERRGSRGFLASSPKRQLTERLKSELLEEETPAVSVYSFGGTPSTGTPSIATPSIATPSETPSDAEELDVDVIPRRTMDICETTNYRPGNILRMELRNVMSHEECTFNFGPRLNYVIGPNGSGKSTILAGICLAFAAPVSCMGKPSLKVQHLIKSSKEELEVSVFVKNVEGEADVIFRRVLGRQKRQDKFFIDGKSVSMKEVQSRALELDIQITSKTRFLPQDRVKEFTSMRPKELLITTIEDVGYSNMLSHYNVLVEKQTDESGYEKSLKEASNKLTDLQRRQEELLGVVSQLEECEKMEEQVKRLESVEMVAKGLSLTKAVTTIQEEEKTLVQKLRQLKQDRARVNTELAAQKEEVSSVSTSQTEIATGVSQLWKQFSQIKEREKEAQGEIGLLEGELETAQKRLDQHEEETRNLRQKMRDDETSHSKICEELSSPDFDESKERLLKEEVELKTRVAETKEIQKAAVSEQRTVKDTLDEVGSRLDAEKRKNNSFTPIRKDNLWLIGKVKNIAPPDQFRYSLPALNNVRLKQDNDDDQRMVSAVVGGVARHFVARDDAALLKIMENEEPTAVKEVTKSLQQVSANVPLNPEQMERLGFDGHILDLVEGPEHNLAHLCEVARIHGVPYSRKGLTVEQQEQVPPSVYKYISENLMYTVKKSRHGEQHASSKSEPIDSFLNKSKQISYEKIPDRGRERELQQQYDAANEVVLQANERVEVASQSHDTATRPLQQNKDSLQAIRAKENRKRIRATNLNITRTKLRRHLNEPPASIDSMEVHVKQARRDIFAKMAKLMIQRVDLIGQISGHVFESAEGAVNLARVKVILENAKSRCQEAKTCYEAEADQLKLVRSRLKTANSELVKFDQENPEIDLDRLDPETEAIFQEMTEAHGNDNHFLRIHAEISAIRQHLIFANYDAGARDKRDNVLVEMTKAQDEVDLLTHQQKDAEEQVERIVSVFVPELNKMIELISSRFCTLLRAKEGADGRVELRTVSETTNELLPVSKWGIDIMCSFREGGAMYKLDGVTQSGGERSIAIGIYLLALQGVGPVAFRALDEINQALDPKNEAIINQHIADTAAEFHQQIFLLTPKLAAFKFTQGTRVHTIINGAGVNRNGDSGGGYMSIGHLSGVFASDTESTKTE